MKNQEKQSKARIRQGALLQLPGYFFIIRPLAAITFTTTTMRMRCC